MGKKVFKTISQQIEILKERGLIIEDEEKARQYLLTNNYYNIINGYGKFFQQKDDSDIYINGANFNEVCDLYFYDKEIKMLILNTILTAEHHLKSILAYRFAEEYTNKRYAYLYADSYSEDKVLDITYTISKISRLINSKINIQNKTKQKIKQKIKNSYDKDTKIGINSIYYYSKKYDDIPIWVISDYLNFGDIYYIIKSLPLKIENSIAHDLWSFIDDNVSKNSNYSGLLCNTKFAPETMISFIKNLQEVRNVCAHNNRLLGFKCIQNSKKFTPLFKPFDDKYPEIKGKQNSVFAAFITLQCFVSSQEFAILNNSIRKRTRSLSKKLKSIKIEKIMELLGFPSDWYNLPKLKQH